MTNSNNARELGRILKQQRVMTSLTLRKLSVMSSISASHLGRVERGERFPSASILRRLANPLGFSESELFTLAGYLSPQSAGTEEGKAEYSGRQLDPYVSKILSHEPIEVQHAALGILSLLKSIAKALE